MATAKKYLVSIIDSKNNKTGTLVFRKPIVKSQIVLTLAECKKVFEKLDCPNLSNLKISVKLPSGNDDGALKARTENGSLRLYYDLKKPTDFHTWAKRIAKEK